MAQEVGIKIILIKVIKLLTKVGLCVFATAQFTPWFSAPFRRNQTKSMVNNQTFLLEL